MERNGIETESFDVLVTKAESALSSGDWASAAEGYETLVRSQPEQASLKYGLARAYEGLGRSPDAIALLTDPSVAKLPKTKSRLAALFIRAKNFPAAKPLIDELIAVSPDNPKFQKLQALCDPEVAREALSRGDWAGAAKGFEALVQKHPEQAEFKYELARAYEGLGRLTDAAEILTDTSLAGLTKAKSRLAAMYIRAKDYGAAKPLIDDLIEAFPDTNKFKTWRTICQNNRLGSLLEEGKLLAAAGRLEEAELLYRDLSEEYPQDSRPFLQLGRIYAHQKRWADAVLPLRAGLTVDPGNMKIRTILAKALFKDGKPADAIALLDNVEEDHDDVNRLILLQRCHLKLSNWPAVNDIGSRLQAIVEPDHPAAQWASEMRQDAQVELAAAGIDNLTGSGDVEKALLGYRAIADEFPESALAWTKLGKTLADLERLEDAVSAFRTALSLRPNDMHVREYLSRAIIASQSEEEVLHYVLDAISAGTADFECHHWLAQFHNRHHDWQAALESSQNALAINPKHHSARLWVARSLMRLSRLGEALEELDFLLKVGAKRLVALQLKADILVRLSRLEDAIELYLKALRHVPDHPLINHRLSYAYLLKGDISGFHRYHERRRKGRTFIESNKNYPFLDWNGELPIDGKLLVWSEAGLGVGQNILHMPFLKALVALGMDVVFEVEPRLVALCSRSFPDLTVVANGSELPEGISHHTPIGSLSRWFKPDLASFETMHPYFLPDAQAVAKHRDRLKTAAGKDQILIGISWTSNNPFVGDVKSVPLDQLLSAIALPGVTLVNLQYGDHFQSIELAQAKTGKRLMESGIDNSNDLDSLAAVVAAMDLVVCIGHTTAHMAGAIGAPNFVMLPSAPFAHWLADGERCIWYPATTLYRQAPNDDTWSTVLPRVREAVMDFVHRWDPKAWLTTTLLPRLQPTSALAEPLSTREVRDAVVAFYEQGAFRSALNLMDRLPCEVRSRDLEVLRAEMLALIGHWNEARSLYYSLRSDPDVDQKILSTCLAMYDLEAALLVSRRLGNEDPSCRLVTANILYQLRQYEEALAELRELSIQAPQVDGVTTLTGHVLLEMEAFQRTESYLKDRAAMTRRAEDYTLLGRAISAQGRPEEALAAFEKGVARSRYNPSANFWRTQERIRLGLVTQHPLPPLEGNVPKVTPDETVLFFVADSVFFWQHGLVLIGSLGRSSPQAICHVHVINPDAGIAPAIEIIRGTLPGLRLSYTYEHVDLKHCSDLHIRTYYASVRFVRLAEIFARSPASYLCVDADSIIRSDIQVPQPGEKIADVGLHVRYHDHPQMAVLASASLLRPTAAAAKFIDWVSVLIKSTLETREAVWFLDQIVLGHAVRELGAHDLNIDLLDLTYLDWFFRKESLVWTGKGKRKSDDSRYRREVEKFNYLQSHEKIVALMPPLIFERSNGRSEDELA